MQHYDLIVIGAGAGLNVLVDAMENGLKCAVIENRKFGGTCLTKGCIPSKTLAYPAEVLMEMRQAEKLGLQFELKNIDWATVTKNTWSGIDQHIGLEKSLARAANLTVLKGTASFVKEKELAVVLNDGSGVAEIEGDKIVIAAGARTFLPPVSGLEACGYVTPETFFGDKFPKAPYKSLAIIGGGAIGCEFAHIFSAFGTEVTLIERLPRLLAQEEPEISAHIEQAFVNRGIAVHTNTAAISASFDGKIKQLQIEDNASKQSISIACEEIFLAPGLRSNADVLQVEKAGIATDAHGYIITNEYLETNVPGIWAFGDINGKFQFRHKANKESSILTHNIFEPAQKKRAMDYSNVPWAIYSYPQVAHVGLTEAQVAEKVHKEGKKYYVGTKNYSSVARGAAMGFESGSVDGFIKVVCDENKKLLGAHVTGSNADILIQGLTYLMVADDLRTDKIGRANRPLYEAMVIHPSLNEVANWVFYELKLKA